MYPLSFLVITFVMQMNVEHDKWLEDLSLRLVCVLALDRFGDFVSDEVDVIIYIYVNKNPFQWIPHFDKISTLSIMKLLVLRKKGTPCYSGCCSGEGVLCSGFGCRDEIHDGNIRL